MHPALWISKSGLDAQQFDISVITNNLANVNTTGFKRGRAHFEDTLYQTLRQPGGQSSQNTELPSGVMMGTGVRTVSTEKIFSEGSVITTDNPMDLAIKGKGFFRINLPDGTTGYTRDGEFQLNSSGRMVTGEGYELADSVTIPQDAQTVTVGADGVVSVVTQGSTTPTSVGSIQLADFVNTGGLQPIGENMYAETAASGSPIAAAPGTSGMGGLAQGVLEASNVNVVEELVNLIETQRAYEMNSKAIETVKDMLQYVNQTL